MLNRVLELAAAGRAQATQDLLELIRIPTVSTLPEHAADCRRAAEWLGERLRRMGMTVEIADVPGEKHPVVAAEWHGRPGAPTVAIYGHYDVQPPDPLEEWVSPPFEPVVRDGFIYARGSDDNKGQHMCGLKAAEYWFAVGGPPVNLRFLIEGEEEISGRALPRYLHENAARLATDFVFIADGSFTAPGMPNLTTALRGLLYTEIAVEGAPVDLHSGIYGGVAPNPLNTLAHIISALKGRDGVVTIPGFYDEVSQPGSDELDSWTRLPVGEAAQKAEMGVAELEGELNLTPAERKWARPTLDVHGVIGGFTGDGAKTVIPARARAKVSMRLVPFQDPAKVLSSLRSYASALATPGTTVSVREISSAPPVLTGTDHPGVAAASRAFEKAFGAPAALQREGGSIPVTVDFQEALGARMLVTGFGLPGDALHSPNERYSLDQYHRGIEMVIHLLDELSRT